MADSVHPTAPSVPAYPAPDPSVILPPAPALDHTAATGVQERAVDVVIVGSGPGGGAAAQVLAEAGLSVLVLEQGPATSRFRPNQDQTARYHMQEGGTVVAEGKTLFPIAAGRGVGGGTLINSALSFRTPDAVLDEWERTLKDDFWGIANVGAALDTVSEIVGVCITPEEVAGENNKLIARGVEKLGYEGGLAPRSTPGCKGCGICNYGCPTMGKASANLTFLPRAVNAGATIQADTDVVEILVEGGRAVGVRGVVRHPDSQEEVGQLTVKAPIVLLSAGAIGTPRLLWYSGVAELASGATGKGLHIHPGGAVLGVCDERIELWKGATQGAYCHVPGLPGVLPHTFTAPPEVVLSAAGFVGPRLAEGLDLLPHLCGLIVLVSDKGTGEVRAHPNGRAKIAYDFADKDLERAKLGLVASAKILRAGGAKRFLGPVHGLGIHDTVESFEAALASRIVTDFVMYSAHPMSSCRMGLDPQTSVIDPRGEVHGIPGLYIADASIFPTSIGVNPQLTTMATATLIARRILES